MKKELQNINSPKLWAGRFSEETDALVHQFNASLPIDQRLWRYDILGSIAHVKMLGDCGIIPATEAKMIENGLHALRDDLASGAAVLPADAEDVHMAVETLLTQRIGPVAGKLHTARSRNDQVATDIRLYARDALRATSASIRVLQRTLLDQAETHLDTLMPGMTHLQHAQPVRLAHHLMAYFWMLQRDNERLEGARSRVNRLPLGAGALAGTSFPINRQQVAQELGFAGVIENSLDAVSDRDFAIEAVADLALIMMHLSRLSEELILWNSPAFGWVEMGDNVTTGSSIMPQKKNPDVAELTRGKTGRVYGDLTALLTMMKGLPLAYNKDLQEDKEPLFDAFDTVDICLRTMKTLLENTTFRKERMADALRGDFSTATDLADYLVQQGLPFRQAHEVVGKLVASCIAAGEGLEELTTERLTMASPLFAKAGKSLLTARSSADARESFGGTGQAAVIAQITIGRLALSLADRGKLD